MFAFLEPFHPDLAAKIASLPESVLEETRRRLFLHYFDQSPLHAPPLLEVAGLLHNNISLVRETRERLASQLLELLEAYSLAFAGFEDELEERDLNQCERWLYDRKSREHLLVVSAQAAINQSALSGLSYMVRIRTMPTREHRDEALAQLKSVISDVLSQEDNS